VSITIAILTLPLLLATPKPGQTAGAVEAAATGQEDLLARGRELIEKGQWARAIEVLGKLRAKGDTSIPLRLALGRAQLGLEMYQQALIEFSEVLKLEPNNLEANLGRAESLIGLGDARKARGPAQLVATLQPENHRAWLLLGQAGLHPQLRDYPAAEKALRRARRLAPDDREANLGLARALSFQKKVEEAIEVLRAWLQRHPEDVPARVRLAESLYAVRDLEEGERQVRKALQQEPGDSEARRVLKEIQSRRAYDFWIPVVALVAFPVLFLLIRRMRRGREIKEKDG